jgi:hypothetical protein
MLITCAVMAKVKNESKLREFAIIGARVRVHELQAEIERIKKQFGAPTLLITGQPTAFTAQKTASTLPRRRGRPSKAAVGVNLPGIPKQRTMSEEARKRISEAQKARWARQKASKRR